MSFQVSRMSFIPSQRAKTPVFTGSRHLREFDATPQEITSWLLSRNQNVQKEGQEGFSTLNTKGQAYVIFNIINADKKADKTPFDGLEPAINLVLSTSVDKQTALIKELYTIKQSTKMSLLLWRLRGKTSLEIIGKLAKSVRAEDMVHLADYLQETMKLEQGHPTVLKRFVTRFPFQEAQDLAAKVFGNLGSFREQARQLTSLLAGGKNTEPFMNRVLRELNPDHTEPLLLEVARSAMQEIDKLEEENARLKENLASTANHSVPAGYDVNEHRKVRD